MLRHPIRTSTIITTTIIFLLITVFALPLAATPSSAQSNTTTPEPTLDFGPTPSYHLTPSPTPHLLETENQSDDTCVPLSEDDPPKLDDDWLELDFDSEFNTYPLDVLTFLNAGGSVETLIEKLSTASNVYGPYLSQVVVHDVVGDSVPEIFFALTIPVIPQGEYGDSFLFMFHCVDEEYVSNLLFLRRGAGSRSEGLYGGGGVRIISIDDLNANGTIDIFYGVNWYLSSIERGHSESYLFEFGDDVETINSLFYSDDPLSDFDHLVYGRDINAVQFEDVDNDGIMEIMIEDRVYVWDGEYYVVAESETE